MASLGVAGLSFQALSGQPHGYRDVTAAGTGQATATALASYSAMYYNVSGADGTKGVRLPAGAYLPGKFIIVANAPTASGACPVYPATGGTINGQSANSSFSLAPGAEAFFFGTSTANAWNTLASSGGASGAGSFNAITITDATTPSLTTQAGSTNTGYVLVNGKTSGSIKLTTADATAQAIVISGAAQTVGGTTLTIPNFAGVNDTFAFTTLAQTLSNKTLDATNINQAFAVNQSQNFTNQTLANVTGLSWTVAAGGTYYFELTVPLLTETTNGGAQMAFKLTTATLTTLNLRVRQTTNNDAAIVDAIFTTTTDQATWFNQKAVVYTSIHVRGAITVGTGGTIAVQAAQNTTHADTTTLAGVSAMMVRTA